MSCGFAPSAIAARIVVTRSAADTPVCTPSRASIDTVNAVPLRLSLVCTIGGSSSARTVSSVRQAHDAAAFADQQRHRLGRDALGGNDQVGFVLAVVVVLQHHGTACAHRFERGGDARRHRFGIQQREIGKGVGGADETDIRTCETPRKYDLGENVSGHCKQTERQPASHTWRSGPDGHDYLHIFSHPDYDRRLWHSTRSADPRECAGARSPAYASLPPVGNFTRPEDALICRMGQPHRRAKHTTAARSAQRVRPKPY